jgi:hypothetical protein
MKRAARIGFIINSRVPEWEAMRRGMPPHAMLLGWDDRHSPMSFMRFRWIASALRREGSVRYELYRPGRSYDAVIFLKSMGASCMALAERLRARGAAILFEANVDYYSQCRGDGWIEAMAPTAEQRRDAIAMTAFADRVIASSRHLAEVGAAYQPRSDWVPDNVNLRLTPRELSREPFRGDRLNVWWSGMAAKAFEFLTAAEAFLAFREKLHLHLVTDDVPDGRGWKPGLKERWNAFLSRIPHTFHRFRDIPQLLRLYSIGGLIVSPRYLDVPYNLSHSEWKITLGMACGLPAVASPVQIY